MIGNEDRLAPKAANIWPKITLRDANVTLIDCDHRTPPASHVGYPYVAIPQLKQGRIDLTDVRRIASEHYRDWTLKAKPCANDVILSRRCNPGETAVVPPNLEFALGQNLVLLRADGTRVYPPFLRWLVRSPEWWEQIQKYLNVGAVFDSLKCADVPNFELIIPPLTVQHRIAHILSTLDDKIELNRQMNETLESMARAIFKSWFVDFDPVRAKAEGRQPVGMDAATAALFPDDFEEVDGREVPRGWKIKPLSDIANFLNGLALQNYSANTDDQYLPVIKIAQLRAGNTIGSDKANINIPPEYIIEDGDILFSWSGSLVVTVWCGGKGALNQHLFKVSTKLFPKWFYYHWILQYLPEFQLIAAGKATTMGHIQRHHLSEMMVLVPPPQQIEVMDKMMAPVFDKIVSNRIESRIIFEVRDLLLAKLISGEIRVDDITL